MMDITLHILSPEGTLAETPVSQVSLPGAAGPFVVLKDHAPLITSLTKGEVVYLTDAGEQRLPVQGGFVEVLHNLVTVCVEG